MLYHCFCNVLLFIVWFHCFRVYRLAYRCDDQSSIHKMKIIVGELFAIKSVALMNKEVTQYKSPDMSVHSQENLHTHRLRAPL